MVEFDRITDNIATVNSIIKAYIELEDNMYKLKLNDNLQYKEVKKWLKYKMKWGLLL